MTKKLVFLDSNVWFSAFYKEGICAQLLRKLIKSSYNLVISELVLEEIIRNLKQKIPEVLSMVIEYIDKIKPIVVKNPKVIELNKFKSFANEKDLPILVSAINYECKFFVTGNIKDFNIKKIKSKTGLDILKPSEVIKFIK